MKVRVIEAKDAKILCDLIEKNRIRLKPFFPTTIRTIYNLESAKRFVKLKIDEAYHQELYYFLVFDDSNTLAGNVTAKNFDWTVKKCELSYFVDIDFEGKGLISKALEYVIHHCFQTLGIEKTYLRIASENERSKKIANKMGFEWEGTHKRDFKTGNGNIVDVEYFALFKNK